MSCYDVKDLAHYMKRAKKANKPFVLFTGAGCSKSAGIPLAFELVSEINKKYALDLKELSAHDKNDYGRCMAALTKEDRRELLKGYIEKANLNWAHIVQALLIERGYIERILTFNFDNILSRSCGLLGIYPSIYDFTSANLDLLDLIIDPSIVHLHGQSHGFIQLNTNEETKQHAEKLSQFIASTLNQSPSIFIGYSGNADAFFPLLKEKYIGQNRLFWIGREKVAPMHINESLINSNNVAHYLSHEDADRFFIELAQELDCFPPEVFKDPYNHLFKQLEAVIDYPIKDDRKIDILASTRNMLRESQAQLENSGSPNYEQLLMQGKYREVINLAKEKKPKEDEKILIAWAELILANQLASRAKRESNPALFEQSFERFQAVLDIKPDMHSVLNDWGCALSELAQLQHAPALFEQSFEKFQASVKIDPEKYTAFYNWGSALSNLAELKQDAALFEQSCEKFQAALAIKPDMHEAHYNWGTALLRLAKLKESPELFEQCFEKYQKSLNIHPDKHEVLNNWGCALFELAKIQQEPMLFEQSFGKFQAALAISPSMHKGFFNWGCALFELAEIERNPELFEQSIEKFNAALNIKPDKYEALNGWGNTLLSLAKIKKNPVLFEQSIEKFQAALAIKPDMHQALFNLGISLLSLALQKQDAALYEQSIEKFQAVVNIKPDMYLAFTVWGSALLELAKLRENQDLLEQAKSKFLKAKSICNEPNYDLACLYSLQHDVINCKDELLACLKAKMIPDKNHLNTDTDLDFVRDKDWFKALL